ncbi:sigma-70 family RNA polymerase sigma factor [Salibacterium salarium]|uniref:Sigma-70 family RNA polymerase sigma factor n=1 Tax=Salibacterium salarium TaxID=284579 RepID=A0A3R9WMT8_9BACI|nr:sigma-70 family RNA polymerase sigma factor [Salibacterium salarium]RSL29776.1 sigma-70 family RNA polymerase sigma factor [Salibacterium salarium]
MENQDGAPVDWKKKMNKHLGIPFEEVAEDFSPLVLGMIKRLRIYKNTEEFTQVGFIALWKAYEKFEAGQSSFSSYAYMWVKGEMLAHLKKEALYDERYYISDFEEGAEPPAPDSLTVQQEVDSIAPYLEQLTPREQEWVIEFSVNGRGITEIANKYNVAPTTVKSWRKSAIKKLRQLGITM